MKSNNYYLRSLLILAFAFMFSHLCHAQENQIRPSQKASVSQFIGNDTQVTITYSRPAVKGRKVWGDLVPYGLAPGNKYSDNKPYPWRAGANENTTIEITNNVKIEGKALPAGKYSIHMIPSEKEWTLILNKASDLWGSYKYDQASDALRVTVSPSEASFQEWLTYGFEGITDNSAIGYLQWEKLKVPFKIELAQ